MNKIMKRISFIVAALAAVAMISCQKEVKEDLTSYYKTFADNSEILGFAEETTQTFSVYAKTTDAGCDVPVTVTFGVDESLVAQYNASKDESEQALLLPASIYSFESQTAEIRAMYRTSGKANIVLTHDASILQEETWYVLPVVITNISGSADAHIADDNVKFLTVKTARAGAGAGTKEKPYLMRTAEDLQSLATLVLPVTSADAEPTYVKLWNDIDLAGVDWKPINTDGAKKIDFDGNGKTISNLGSVGAMASFFGVVFGNVYNVTFKDANIVSDDNGGVLGAACGFTGAAATISNVHCVNCNVLGKKNGVGGFVGQMNVGQITRCSFDGLVSGTGNYVGGIVGYFNKGDAYDKAKVDNCITTGQVIEDGGIDAGHQRYGGIAGGINGQHQFVEYCISTAEVISGTGTAGIVGMAHYDGSGAGNCLGHDNTVKCCIAWNPKVYARKIQTKNYSPGAVIGFASIDGNYIDCVRRPDMEFVQNLEQTDNTKYPINWWTVCDQENSSSTSPLTDGINCDHSSVYCEPYHGKAAAEGETASAVAKRLKWDESIWDLSGAIPALK